MLAHLFPHRKRSVLELILRRCDLDLLKAIEQCRPAPSAFKPVSKASTVNHKQKIDKQIQLFLNFAFVLSINIIFGFDFIFR